MIVIENKELKNVKNITSDKRIIRSELKFDLHILTCDIYCSNKVAYQKEIVVNDYDYDMIMEKGYYIA